MAELNAEPLNKPKKPEAASISQVSESKEYDEEDVQVDPESSHSLDGSESYEKSNDFFGQKIITCTGALLKS
jgi:hypothetical protein